MNQPKIVNPYTKGEKEKENPIVVVPIPRNCEFNPTPPFPGHYQVPKTAEFNILPFPEIETIWPTDGVTRRLDYLASGTVFRKIDQTEPYVKYPVIAPKPKVVVTDQTSPAKAPVSAAILTEHHKLYDLGYLATPHLIQGKALSVSLAYPLKLRSSAIELNFRLILGSGLIEAIVVPRTWCNQCYQATKTCRCPVRAKFSYFKGPQTNTTFFRKRKDRKLCYVYIPERSPLYEWVAKATYIQILLRAGIRQVIVTEPRRPVPHLLECGRLQKGERGVIYQAHMLEDSVGTAYLFHKPQIQFAKTDEENYSEALEELRHIDVQLSQSVQTSITVSSAPKGWNDSSDLSYSPELGALKSTRTVQPLKFGNYNGGYPSVLRRPVEPTTTQYKDCAHVQTEGPGLYGVPIVVSEAPDLPCHNPLAVAPLAAAPDFIAPLYNLEAASVTPAEFLAF
jgi:hypothetical protein